MKGAVDGAGSRSTRGTWFLLEAFVATSYRRAEKEISFRWGMNALHIIANQKDIWKGIRDGINRVCMPKAM